MGFLLERQEAKRTSEDSACMCTCPVSIFNLDPKIDLCPDPSLLHARHTKQKRFNMSSKIKEHKACYLTQCSNFAAHSNMKGYTLLLQHNTFQNISPKHRNTEL